MKFHGYELVSDWKNSQCGQTASAVRAGKKYFLKKYQTPVAPINNGTLDAKTFAHNEKLFNEFVDTRKRVNAAIRTIAGSGGNIVIPCDEFIEGNQYVEAAEFVDGAIDDDETEGVLASLSVDVKKLLMQTAAGALFSVHSKGIIHSDLKLKNVLLVRNKTGNYVAKLIDFDSSYFVDEKPEEIVGTIDYYSPELGEYADSFHLASGKLQTICYKADIEAALRTGRFGGFELLGLNDFSGQGTALVGVVDVFWDSKKYVSGSEYRKFCNYLVPLARMDRLIYQTDEDFTNLSCKLFGIRSKLTQE